MHKKYKSKKEVVSVNGRKHQVTTFRDHKGKILHKIISPLKIDFHPKDMLQVIIGSSILAIPVGYTEETWRLGETLALPNIFAFMVLSLLFIAAFTFYHYYKDHIGSHWLEFIKRVVLTYTFAFLVVAVMLSIIERTPWGIEPLLSFKRTVIVAFPASLSGSIADVLK